MAALYEVIGSTGFDSLLANPHGADAIGIPCTPGNGTVSRGTVMYRDATTGLWAPAAAANAVITNQLAILDETVDTTGVPGEDAEGSDIIIAETARAYRAGHFVAGKVHLKAEAALTAAVVVVLREQGMVFDRVVANSAFNNSVEAGD